MRRVIEAINKGLLRKAFAKPELKTDITIDDVEFAMGVLQSRGYDLKDSSINLTDVTSALEREMDYSFVEASDIAQVINFYFH